MTLINLVTCPNTTLESRILVEPPIKSFFFPKTYTKLNT